MALKLLRKKDKADSMTAARVSNLTLEILKRNNINVSLTIREYLDSLAKKLINKKAS